MHRLLTQLLFIGLCLFSSIASANDEPLTIELNKIQSAIDSDVKVLTGTKGEIKSFIEYRISRNATLLQEKLKQQIEDTPAKLDVLKPYIVKQLAFTNQVEDYFKTQRETLMGQVGADNDREIMLKLVQIQREQDKLYVAEKELLAWATMAGVDVEVQNQRFIKALESRADDLDSFVHYNQSRLTQAVTDVTVAGKDATSEQTAVVVELKERLAQSSTSLSTAIELLDELGEDTAIYKQTLFSISGDITQDVLNLDVASSLLSEWMSIAKNQALENGASVVFKLLIFSLILFLSSLVGKIAKRIVQKTVSNSKLKFSYLLQDFFISMVGKVVFALGLLIGLSQLGFELAPLLAGFGIAGVIIGFALQDTLSNFASGMMILIYRPFDVDDLINAAGVTGRVSHMSLVSTTIKTLDNQRLIIPNNKIWGDTINNITVEQVRRVDLTFGIGYKDSIEHAEKVLNDVMMSHPKVLKSPEPMIKLHTLGESSVDFIVRPWVKPIDYWDVYWDITREVKMRFDAEGISIPFPQRDVHIYQET
ncbi:mechanosensitive ion channel protein [Shewanella sp. Choline-02u-19]|uniref:mechanosensitive ion channel family protein n=1 Tax=unclassified Shewanella TaxID=196818 RepID=UPI000C337436|nr:MULTISPECIES: mechanosensitive ion channel family protein [unclassified Shewanella]PKG58724.1 mechanosensitive ion channel protein [Shewanella sp. GutDb-MelDb]PKH58874.1 mechanosensitive ion channel protein [Shewanella sp. Bg11-22]PKI28979.1 mechanosensitive ion channel protein [Shewanella sp. Choline-02u-19]